MTAFDNWAELDPYKLQRDIETSGCSDVMLTRYGDVEDMVRRVNENHPGTVDLWGNLDPHRLLQQLGVGCASGGYVTKAVTFVGDTIGAELNFGPVSDDSKITVSGWTKFTTDGFTALQNVIAGTGVQLAPGANLTTDLGGALQNGSGGAYFRFGSADGVWTVAGAFHHFFLSADMGHADGKKIINLCFDGVDVLDPVNTVDGNAAFDIFIGTGGNGNLAIPERGGQLYDQDYADMQIWIGQCVTPTVNNLAKFISDGKPVDPAQAAAAFGLQTFLFSGDHTQFAVNQGIGPAATLTGTLTDATTSPSD